MTPDELRAFVADNHHAVLATKRRDGGVQMSPLAVVVDDDGTVIISSRETAIKTLNLRRDPHGWLCILNDRFFGSWAQAEGPVAVESLPEAMEGLVRYYRKGFGEHPDWDDYRAAMVREQRVLLRMTVERVGPTTQG